MNINLELYKLTQSELLKYVVKQLKKEGVEFDVIDNQIISLTHPNKPVFVAHLDTVRDSDMSKPLIVTKTTISREGGILGADDRAGVNLILNHCKDINFILTRDEEIGCLGIKSLVKNHNIVDRLKDNNTPFLCELDRKGNSDIIGHIHGYCGEDLQGVLEQILEGYSDAVGVYTDIDQLTDYFPCVNLSVGYYNPHAVTEYLNIKDFNYINSKIKELSALEGVYKLGVQDSWFGDWEVCDICGRAEDLAYVELLRESLCYDCRLELINELCEI